MISFLRSFLPRRAGIQENIVLIGDSTIDNKLWSGPGVSVLDHLRRILPNVNIKDLTNAGFTTSDILLGQYRDCVVNESRDYPHQIFRPLVDGQAAIRNAHKIILSVGGNNIRDFLLSLEQNPLNISKFDKSLDTLVTDYQEILLRIKELNPNAEIILMTQYYPALHQKSFEGINLYSAFAVLAPVLSCISFFRRIIARKQPVCTLGGQNYMHLIVNKIFNQILQFCLTNNIRCKTVDITSSLDPNDSTNYEFQIEPSATGGYKIAKMLSFGLGQEVDYERSRGVIYRFTPDFFSADRSLSDHVETLQIREGFDYRPLHPREFIQPQTQSALRSFIR